MPESEWGEYFARLAREAGEEDSPLCDREARARVAQEAGAYYAYGGRGTVEILEAASTQQMTVAAPEPPQFKHELQH